MTVLTYTPKEIIDIGIVLPTFEITPKKKSLYNQFTMEPTSSTQEEFQWGYQMSLLEDVHTSGSASVLIQAHNILDQLIFSHINLRRISEISEYLAYHPDMTDLIWSACLYAANKFSPEAQLTLEIYHDPEIIDEHPILYVRKQIYDDDIINQIDQLQDQFMDALAKTSGWFLITTDFQPLQV